MPKVELSNVSSGYNLAAINSNFEKIETALNDSVLFRDDVGTNPNSMSVDLDMNGKRIFNLPAPVLDNEPLRKGDVGDLAGTVSTVTQLAAEAAFSAETAIEASNSAQLALEAIGTSVADAAASAVIAEGFADAAESSSRLTVGTVTTGSPGSSASVSITGTPGTQAISFTIPRGDVGPQGIQGETGATGPQGIQGETGPQGPQGIQGIQGIQGPAGTGDVVGPASSTDNSLPRFDGTTGKLLQGSGVMVDDGGGMTLMGFLTAAGLSAQSDTAASYLANAANNRYWRTQLRGSPTSPSLVIDYFNGSAVSTPLTLDTSGNLTLTAGTLGYGAGAGGTVTQITSKSTAVTLNKPSGRITMHNGTLGAGIKQAFVFNNSFISINDTVVVGIRGPGYIGAEYYMAWVGYTFAGGVYITIENITAGPLADAVEINFAVIKGSTT